MHDVRIRHLCTVPVPVDADAYRDRFGSRFRRVGPYVRAAQLGAAGVLDALDEPPSDLGIWFGTGLANLATIVPLVEAIFHPRAPRCSPLAFARSVGNAAAFFVAQAFELEGENVTVSQEEISFEAALLEAWLALRAGDAKQALVGALDVLVDDDGAQRTRLAAEGIPGEVVAGGASFWFLDAEGPWRLSDVRIGRFDPLAGLPDGATVYRGWRAGDLELPSRLRGPAPERRLFSTASGVTLTEAMSAGTCGTLAHVQRHGSGAWARVVVEGVT